MPCILIVDDDDDTREAISRILAEEGFVVRTASDGADAAKSMGNGSTPGLILLDARMPTMDGRHFLDWLKARQEFDRVHVIVMSADSTVIGRDARATAVLRKPFNIDELLRLARKYCA
jgi:DNA-binding response OmpR family regulator